MNISLFNKMRAFREGKKVFYIKALARYTLGTSKEQVESRFIPYAAKEIKDTRRLGFLFTGEVK